jgi:hypothetical protein
MPSYTTSLRLVQPATGEYSGTWGTEVNNGLTALVDASIAGTSSITMTAANFTLTTANGASDQSRAMFLVLGGTPGASYAVIVPSVSKLYFVTNNTGFAQTVRTSGTGISVPNGASMTLRCDGTNVVVAQNYFASMTLGSALPVASGGTGLTSYTSGGVVYASSTSALATGSGLVFDGSNLGIGTTSPGYKLTVGGSSPDIVAANTGANSTRIAITASNTAAYVSTTYSGSGIPLIFNTAGIGAAGSTQMTLDSSGNLGLGVTPGTWASGAKALQIDSYSALFESVVGRTSLAFNARESASGSYNYLQTEAASVYQQVSGKHEWFTAPSGTAGNAITFTQAMTLDSSGDLLLGTTGSYSGNGSRQTIYYEGAGTEYGITLNAGSVTTNATAISFLVNGTTSGSGGTAVGSITCSGSATAYNTSSDYRLKDNQQPLTNCGAFIDALQPKTWNWKADGSKGVGFIAHEVQAVSPGSVVGEKDAVDADGKLIMQAMEYGSAEFIANIVAELQSLRARVAALEQA